MKKIFCMLFCLFAQISCFGYVFAGAIYDENGLFINGATVSLLTSNTLTTPVVTTTSILGNYSFPDVDENIYSLLIGGGSGSTYPINSFNVAVIGDSSFNNY